jgi:putative FmdB family regulatory protein
MPVYDYKCILCGTVIEFRKEFGEDRGPTCCSQLMQRVWNATPAIFNGSGFYRTDNRK